MANGKLVSVEASHVKFRGQLNSSGWTLCIGAGISRDIAPSWFDLARNILNEVFSSHYTEAEFRKLIENSGWGLDAWIQAAANEYLLNGKTSEDFTDLIEDELYGKIKAKASGTRLAGDLVKVLNNPLQASKEHIIQVCEFFESNFPDCSLLETTHFLIDSEAAQKNPVAVLTFNADTLLETLIVLFERRKHYSGPGPYGHPLLPYRSVRRPSDAPRRGIPIYHCHGAITPRSAGSSDHRDSRDRLIFLENEYLKVATTSAAWPESLFLFYAQTTRMVFLGLSMADSNIRRWMNSAYIEEKHDLTLIAKGTPVNPSHLWVTKRPADSALERINLVALNHLGIRPAWLDDWRFLRASLNNLIAM